MNIAPSHAAFASPIESAPRNRGDAGGEDSARFSYALAAASLERQASQSLNAHGARPNANPGATAQTRRQPSDANQIASKGDVEYGASGADEQSHPPLVSSAQQNRAPATPATHSNAASTSTPPIAAGSAQHVAKATGAVTAPDTLAAKTKVAPAKSPRTPAPAPALKSEFAEILAKRLEKSSAFDLRLDPPELGRVEGRLVIGDDGKSVLSLTFDNQSAFDLLSRDEYSLRDALAQAGLNFDTGDFVFSFREQSGPEGPAPGFDRLVKDVSKNDEPVFFANWSAGALDIRI